MQEVQANLSESAPEQAVNSRETTPGGTSQESSEEHQLSSKADTNMKRDFSASCSSEDASPKLLFFLEGQQLERNLTLYQAIMQKQIKEHESVASTRLWSQVYTLTYRKFVNQPGNLEECTCSVQKSVESNKNGKQLLQASFFSSMFASDLASDLEESSPTYDILYLLKCLERMNRFIFHLISQERMDAFAVGTLDHLDDLKITVPSVLQNEFVSSKLTEKLEQQMRDPLAVSVGGMPSWCNQLMASCPFLFSFEARCKYFRLGAFGQLPQSHSDSGVASDRRPSSGGLPRKKFLVSRDSILESAKQMMEMHARHKGLLEVVYNEEVGTGIGPTLEFYTLVSHEFQKNGLGMWRDDYGSSTSSTCLQPENREFVMCLLGLFPRPWSSSKDASDGSQFSEVINKFVLLGQIVAKALQNGRVLDLHISRAFYKLILGQVVGFFFFLLNYLMCLHASFTLVTFVRVFYYSAFFKCMSVFVIV